MPRDKRAWLFKRKERPGWWVGWYESGKRKAKALPSRKLAEHYCQLKYSQLNSDVFTGIVPIAWKQMLEEYMESKKVQGVTEATLYEIALRLRHFERLIGKYGRWDYDYGYRQLKVKIGRSGKWYEHDKGLAMDIEIVRMIHDEFGDEVDILVDANDMYSLDDTIAFLKGVEGVPIYWMEEPFIESLEDGRKLKDWMMANGRKETRYADGERAPKIDVCMKLAKEGKLDVFLADIFSYGMTPWRRLMPSLNKTNTSASPHTWGNRLKTNYTAHLAAGLGNVCTIEGVTCISDDIDYGDYKIIDGKIQVSEKPGFGMKILNTK